MAFYAPIHDRFERFCKARAYGYVGYKDLMHDTVLIAFEKFDSLNIEHEKEFLHFLFGTSIRVLANSNRKKHPVHFNDEQEFSSIEDQDHSIESSDNVHLLYHALSQLPEEQREAIVLFEISGFSIAEVAQLQSAGISAVKQRLARGRKALLTILNNEQSPIRKEVTHD